jgi:hypothetical protein
VSNISSHSPKLAETAFASLPLTSTFLMRPLSDVVPRTNSLSRCGH